MQWHGWCHKQYCQTKTSICYMIPCIWKQAKRVHVVLSQDNGCLLGGGIESGRGHKGSFWGAAQVLLLDLGLVPWVCLWKLIHVCTYDMCTFLFVYYILNKKLKQLWQSCSSHSASLALRPIRDASAVIRQLCPHCTPHAQGSCFKRVPTSALYSSLAGAVFCCNRFSVGGQPSPAFWLPWFFHSSCKWNVLHLMTFSTWGKCLKILAILDSKIISLWDRLGEET